MPVMKILSQATRIIAEGEVLQLSKIRDASTTEETYMEVIRGKPRCFSRPRLTVLRPWRAPHLSSEALRTLVITLAWHSNW